MTAFKTARAKLIMKFSRLRSAHKVAIVGIGSVIGLFLLGAVNIYGAILIAMAIGGAGYFFTQDKRQAIAIRKEVVIPTGLHHRVRQFADNLVEPCIIIDMREVVVYANQAGMSNFPRLREGDLLVFAMRQPEIMQAIDKAIATLSVQRAELHMTEPNDVWYRAAIVPYTPDGENGEHFMILTLFDVTEQRRTDTLRRDFVANASHELRTPLTSLMGFIETLQGPAAKDEAARTRFLGIMRNQAERMSGLVDDLLSLSRIELRQHVKPTDNVNLNLLLREVADSMEPKLRSDNMVLNVNVPEDSVIVRGDRQELFEVFENLVDNAIKYGVSGGVADVNLVSKAIRGGEYNSITVTDYGQGIAEEHVPRLTERFYRVDAESNRRKKGTGLGLAIVKHIISRHHGQIFIRSVLGKGTSVEILLK